jgi:3-methyladenine DNA glycosylase/8-oxoguanine DNA glycosylase
MQPSGSTKLRLAIAAGSRPLLTLAPLWQGPGDPTMHQHDSTVVRATRTGSGPASLRLRFAPAGVLTEAWGPGAETALRALPALLGESDDPTVLRPQHSVVAQLARRFAGVRLTRAGNVWEMLLPTVLGQKVTSFEARRSYRLLVQRYGEPAPGPLGLLLQPDPALVAGLPYHALHPLGIERRRADTLRAAAGVARQLQALADGPEPGALRRGLETLPGVGPWTAAEVVRLVLGDPDAVSIGDYNLPGLVSWALAGQRRADDQRMLQLLEPYRGQRARVVLLLELGGRYPPRRGPRFAPRSIAAI